VQEGGNNTKYFHLIANRKHRKKRISQLEKDEGTIVVEENLKFHIIEYYKKLFGAPIKNTLVWQKILWMIYLSYLKRKIIFSQLGSLKRKYSRLFLRWNLIKLWGWMGFRWSIINNFGRL
jgi:hypothetical protein